MTNDDTAQPSDQPSDQPTDEPAVADERAMVEAAPTKLTRASLGQRIDASPAWVRFLAGAVLAFAVIFGIGAGGFALGQESGGQHNDQRGDGHGHDGGGDASDSGDTSDTGDDQTDTNDQSDSTDDPSSSPTSGG